MRHVPLFGALGTLFVILAMAGEYGCSTSTSLPGPPGSTVIQVGGSGGVVNSATGGTRGTITSSPSIGGTTSASGGATAATGGTVSATGGAAPCTQTMCTSGCVDTTSDHDNCAVCDRACAPEQICSASTCTCPPESPNGCGIRCVDFQTATKDCSSCNNDCTPKRCVLGACGCKDTDITCGANGACFDPMTDLNNCGACGTKCGQYDLCVQGQCVLSCSSYKNSAGVPLTDCGGTCIDTTKDSSNCGACGAACPNLASFACTNSTCVCGNSLATRCGDLCVDVTTDNRFCGSCDVKCTAQHSCVASACVCSSTATACGTGCYDLTSDDAHCGDCTTACGTGFHCVASACVCNPGLSLCSGQCLNTQTDPTHCGGCTTACGAGQSCTAGNCQCDPGFSLCSGSCYNEQTDSAHCGDCTTTCSASQSCIAGKCQCGNGALGNALTACGQACVDAQNDAQNCGGCGTATAFKCTPKQMCQGAKCITSVVDVKSTIQADSTQQTQLYVNISVCNASGASLNLNGYSLKYWYTEDGATTAQMTNIDYAGGASVTVTASLLDPPAFRVKATSVMVVKFGATTLAAGACTGTMQLRVFDQGYTCCYAAQAGDYSYQAGALADNQNITAYNAQGLLIWGLEPAPQ